MKVTAIVPAAGLGERMREGAEKLYLSLGGKPILIHTLEALSKFKTISEIVLVVNSESMEKTWALIMRYKLSKVKRVVPGGPTRVASVYNGLSKVGKETKYVLIHDGARPFVSRRILIRVVAAAKRYGAAVAGVPLKSTIKKVDSKGLVRSTPRRHELWEVQTPQVFKAKWLRRAHQALRRKKFPFTDDASLVEKLKYKVKVVEGSYENIKITTPEDLVIADALLKARAKV